MERQADHVNTYKQVKVNTAHPGKIIVMLYDEALKQIDVAIQKLGDGVESIDVASAAILKTHDIVTELAVSLDMDQGGEIAKKLYNLYDFFSRQLIQANVKKDADILRSVRIQIASLRESWHEIANTPMPQDTTQFSTVDING